MIPKKNNGNVNIVVNYLIQKRGVDSMKMSIVNQNKNHIKNVLGVEELATQRIIVMLILMLKDMIYIINKFDL